MKRALILAVSLLPLAVHAQGLVLSAPSTYSDAQAVAAAKAAGMVPSDGGTPASTAQLAAAIPAPCATTPAADTLNGTVGSAAPCTPRADQTRPTAVQRAIVTTDASGNWAVTWARPFAVMPAFSVKPIIASGKGDCGVSSNTATGASGSCWTYQSVVVSVLGATVSPIATAAAGVPVMLVAGPPSQ